VLYLYNDNQLTIMSDLTNKKISVVVPVFNEADGLEQFNDSLVEILKANLSDYEIVYCNDGSLDKTREILHDLSGGNHHISYISLTRNFGKENALSAGIFYASGEAVMMLDGDGQHPVGLIPEFIKSWLDGNPVVVGIRQSNSNEGIIKKWGSYLFYKTFNKITGQKIPPGSTDFRLIDRSVQEAFVGLKDADRITRGLIDWLGFKTSYIEFKANPRQHGSPSYSIHKLVKLALNSYVGFSNTPLYFFGYLGAGISTLSFILGLAIFIEQLILGDPLSWKFTGTAMLAILIIFLVGIVLMAQGILAVYVSLMHNQTKQRPLFVVDVDNSSLENDHNHAKK
jgi:dolichol-phosphate mannosyltransferase